MDACPSLFISHGVPDLALGLCPTGKFLSEYGASLGRPDAIIVVSSHFEMERPTVSGVRYPPTIHDFEGFDPGLHRFQYRAPGSPELARAVFDALKDEEFDPALDPMRGFDHGTWVPLSLLFPRADIPVVTVSVCEGMGPLYHRDLGRCLRPFRRHGVLVIGSGTITHNLDVFLEGRYHKSARPPDWVTRFSEWLNANVEAGASDDLLNYRQLAPNAAENHPTEEHLMPLFVAMGAADHPDGTCLHRGHSYGVMAMDAYRFD